MKTGFELIFIQLRAPGKLSYYFLTRKLCKSLLLCLSLGFSRYFIFIFRYIDQLIKLYVRSRFLSATDLLKLIFPSQFFKKLPISTSALFTDISLCLYKFKIQNESHDIFKFYSRFQFSTHHQSLRYQSDLCKSVLTFPSVFISSCSQTLDSKHITTPSSVLAQIT